MYKKSFVSVSITSEKLQLVQLSAKKDKVLKFDSVDLPKGIIVNYKVVDSKALSEVIKTIWKKNSIRETSIGVIVPEFSTFTKTLTLPQLEVEELDEAVRWQAQEFLPSSGSSMVMDWKVIKNIGQTRQILAVAIPTDVLSGYVTSLEDAGLFPLVVETPSISLVRLTTKTDDEKLIIYSNSGEAILIMTQGEKILGSVVTESHNQEGVFQAATQMMRHYSEVPAKKVVLGGLEVGQSLHDELVNNLKLPVEWAKINVLGFSTSQLQDYLIPLSLQLKDPTEPADETTINLLPPNWVKQYEHKRMRLRIWSLLIFATLTIIISLLSVVAVFIMLLTQKNALSKETAVNEGLSTEAQKEIQKINSLSEKTVKLTEKDTQPQTIVNLVSKSLTEGVVIDKYIIDLEEGAVIISGIASTRQNLVDFKKKMDNLDEFGPINIPLSSLLLEQNLIFELNFVYLPLSKPRPATLNTIPLK